MAAAHTPVEDFLSEKRELEKAAVKARAQKDFQLWEQWKQGGEKEEDLEVLMKQIDPIVRKASNVYSGKVNIPRSAIRAEFQIQAIHALKRYDPKRGAQVGTYLTSQLRRGKRFITNYQNIGRIPETRVYKIREFEDEKMRLADRLGRDPTAHELSDRLKWPINQVSAMEVELSRKEVPTSLLQADMTSLKPSRPAEVMRLIQYELAPEEKAVYEYLLGVNGKPQLKPGQIAAKLRIPPSKVSRIKAGIGQKVSRYY